MYFYERGNRYVARFRDRSRDPANAYVSLDASAWTKTDARAYARELQVLYDKGEWDPWTQNHPHDRDAGREPTIGEALADYIDEKVKAGQRGETGGWSDATRKGKETVLQAFARHAGIHDLISDLGFEDMRSYVYAGDRAVATRKGYRRAINAFVNWCRDQGHDVPKALPPIRQDVPIPEYVTEDELYAICEAHCQIMAEDAQKKHASPSVAWDRGWMTTAWRFTFYQGLRRGELLQMRRRHIDAQAWTLRIPEQKSGRDTIIPIPPPARDVIRPRFIQCESGDRLFDYDAAYYLSRAFKEAAARVIADQERVSRLRFHSLRHSCAVYWRRQGMSLADIRDLLRHTSITTTEIYDKMVPTDLSARFEEAAAGHRGYRQDTRSRQSPP